MKKLIAVALILAVAGIAAFAQTPGKVVPASSAKLVVQTKEPKVIGDALAPDKAPNRGGTLTISLTGSPQTFMYYGAIDGNANIVCSVMLDRLAEPNPITQELEPALATSWTVKGNEVTFKLRDIKWSDGVPFTADDVIFTFENFVQNKNAEGGDVESYSANGTMYKWVKIDDHTVKCVMPIPSAVLPRMTTFDPILPKHALAALIDPKDPGSVNKLWTTDTDPAKIPGTGAFVLEKYIVDQKVVMKRNPYSWRVDKAGNLLPYFDKLEYNILKDPEALALKFMAGEIDYIDGISSVQFPTLKEKELAGGAFNIYRAMPTQNTPSPVHLGFNWDNKNPDLKALFRQKDFRMAVEYAIDRNKIIDQVYNGLAILSGTPVQPSNKAFYNPKIEKIRRSFDMAKAKALLDKIGIVDKNGDGVREFANEKPVQFVISCSTTKEYNDTAILIADSLKKLGFMVDVQVNNIQLAGQKYAAGEYDMAIRGFGNQPDPHLRKGIFQPGRHLYYWHLSTINTEDGPNFAEMTTWEKEVYDIFEKGQAELDPAKRKALYDRYQEIFAEEVPIIFLIKGMNLYGASKKIGNFSQNKEGIVAYAPYAVYRK